MSLESTLGKQYGPLPLGAWLFVVGTGLGIAYWTTQRQKADPIVVEDTSGVAGVGVGGSGQYTQLTPVVPAPGNTTPTTNEEWGQRAIQWLLARNYPPNLSDSAVRKYLAAVSLSASEYTLIGLVLLGIGPPPQALPPVDEVIPTTPPVDTPAPSPGTAPSGLTATSLRPGWVYLKWNRVGSVNTYRVYGPNGAGFWDVTGNDMEWWVPWNVSATYAFSVATRDGATIGPKSPTITYNYRKP